MVEKREKNGEVTSTRRNLMWKITINNYACNKLLPVRPL